jgi:hypothetical protein
MIRTGLLGQVPGEGSVCACAPEAVADAIAQSATVTAHFIIARSRFAMTSRQMHGTSFTCPQIGPSCRSA